MIKRIAPALLFMTTGLLLVACLSFRPVLAQNLQQTCVIDPDSDLCQDANADTNGSSVLGLLRSVANLVSIVAGIAGVVMVLLGGFRYIRSSGDASKTSEAQNTLIYAVLGLVVAAAGQLIVVFVFNRATT
jgi:hypothetical protein